MGESFKDGVLSAHNECRKKHNTAPVSWSDQLASDAQGWADYIANLGKLQRASMSSRSGQGENLASSGGMFLKISA